MSSDRVTNVCFAVSKYPPRFGGHGIQIQRLIPFLRKRGIAPTVLTSRFDGVDSAIHLEDADHVLRLLPAGNDPLRRVRRVIQFRRHFTKNARQYHVLHSALLNWEFLLNVSHVKNLGLPVIVEMVLLGSDDPLKILNDRFGRLKLWLLRSVDAWVGIAKAFLPRVVAAGIPEDRFHLIYVAVDCDKYRPQSSEQRRVMRAKHGIRVDARVVVSAGSVIRRKGMDRVVKAWAKMRPSEGRDLLLIIGPNDTADGLPPSELAYVAEVREFVESAGLGDTVRFVGFTENLQEYLGLADLFLFLSRREGLGTVNLEAMACGLPCVVSELDGIAAEIIDESQTGHIIKDAENAELVASTLSRLLDNPAIREAMSREARRSAVERFSFETRAEALSALYEHVVDQTRHERSTQR